MSPRTIIPGAIAILALATSAALADDASTTVENGQVHIRIVGDGGYGEAARAVVTGDPVAALAAGDRWTATRPDTGLLAGPDALAKAAGAGLTEGRHPWRATITFDPEHGVPVWRVANTTDDALLRSAGDVVILDARTGEVLGRDEWSVTIEPGR